MRLISLKLSSTASLAFYTFFSGGQKRLYVLSMSRVNEGEARLNNTCQSLKKAYLQDILSDVVCIFESWAMSLINRLHASLKSFIFNWFSIIMNCFFSNHWPSLTAIHWQESVIAKRSMARSHNVLVLYWLRESRLLMAKCSTCFVLDNWVVIESSTIRPAILASVT